MLTFLVIFVVACQDIQSFIILDMDDVADFEGLEELAMWAASGPSVMQRNSYSRPSMVGLSPPAPVVSDMPRHSNDDISYLWSELGRQQKIIEKQELTMNAILDEVRSLSLRMTSAPVAEVYRSPPKVRTSPEKETPKVLTAPKKEQKEPGGRPGKKTVASFSSESESDSDRVEVPDTRTRRRRRSSVEWIANVLAQHSSKEAPKPEPFTLQSGKSIVKFLDRFEKYCLHKFSDGTYEQWTGELGTFLRDDMLSIYKANGGGDRDFSDMKKKLIEYCEEAKDRVSTTKYEKFLYAKIQPGEEMYMYALRLERLYQSAYPGQNAGESHELRARYLNSVSQMDARDVEKEWYLMKALKPETTLNWTSLKTLLRYRHALEVKIRRPNEDVMSSTPVTPSVWYTSQTSQQSLGPSVPGPVPNRMPLSEPRPPAPSFRSPDRPRTKTFYPARSSQQNSPTQLVCTWCHLVGHHVDVCRRRLGLCLACGSSDHYLEHCPRRARPGTSNRTNRSPSPTTPLPTGPRSPSPKPQRLTGPYLPRAREIRPQRDAPDPPTELRSNNSDHSPDTLNYHPLMSQGGHQREQSDYQHLPTSRV